MSRRKAPNSFAAYSLPPGRHGLPRELVVENQRWRLLGAAAEVLAEKGYAHTKSSDIATCAGISTYTFYEHFDNVGECLLAAYETAADCVCDLVSGTCDQGRAQEWTARLRTALDELLAFLASEPSLAHLLASAAPAGDAAIAAARDRLVEHLADLLGSARELRGDTAPELPLDIERRLIAASVALLSDHVRSGEVERLPELAPELAAIFTAPYLGARA